MKKLLLLVCFCLPLMLLAEEITLGLDDILTAVSQHNSRLKSDELILKQSAIAREMVLARRGVQLNGSLGPAYSFSRSGDEENGTTFHQINPGISLSRSLPTGGSVSLSADNRFGISDSANSDDTIYSQNPGLSFSFSQPLFTNGKIIDSRLYSASLEQADNNYFSSEITLRGTRNSLIISAGELFFSIALLRDRIDLKEREIEQETERRLQEEKLQEKGRSTSKEVWEKRLAVGRLMEEKLQLEYSLKQSENQLAILTGAEEGYVNTAFVSQIPEIPVGSAFFSKESLIPELQQGNAGIVKGRYSLENTRLAGILNEQSGAIVSFSGQLDPSLPESDSFGGSFEGYSDDDATLDYSLGLSVSIPLYTGGSRRLQNESDEINLSREEEQLKLVISQALNTLDELLLNRRMLEQKLILAGDNLDFSRKHFDDSSYYFKIGQLTEGDVLDAGISADSQEIYKRQIEFDLYLNYLLILDHIGKDLQEYLGS